VDGRLVEPVLDRPAEVALFHHAAGDVSAAAIHYGCAVGTAGSIEREAGWVAATAAAALPVKNEGADGARSAHRSRRGTRLGFNRKS